MSDADRRTVHTDALAFLGKFLEGTPAARDAIHLAVERVRGVDYLSPGEAVGFVAPGLVSASARKLVGIVDPFLTDGPCPGNEFFLVLFPGTVTSLRHVWEHPDIPAQQPEPAISAGAPVSPSEQWLRDFAERCGLGYSTLMDGAKTWVATSAGSRWGGEYLCLGGLLEGQYVPAEFWPHYEAVTGAKVPTAQQENFFTCSC